MYLKRGNCLFFIFNKIRILYGISCNEFTKNKVVSYHVKIALLRLQKGVNVLEDVYVKIDNLKAEQKEIMRDIRNLETRTTINEKDIATINKQLEKISLNTTWILRIIISAITMSVLGLILKGMI